MKSITSKEHYHEVKDQQQVVFMFTADWCPDCHFVDPFMPEIEEIYQDFSFYSVDRDELIDLCVEEDIFGIPSFIAYNKGIETGRYVGKERKTREQIEGFLNQLK